MENDRHQLVWCPSLHIIWSLLMVVVWHAWTVDWCDIGRTSMDGGDGVDWCERYRFFDQSIISIPYIEWLYIIDPSLHMTVRIVASLGIADATEVH
jgi:hypothetical protein